MISMSHTHGMHTEMEPVASRDTNDLLNTNDGDTRYGKESETRSSETRPPHLPADPHNEEKTEQQKQPQCNHNQCETQDMLIVAWARIGFPERSFSRALP